ncbi:hypothetical protein APP_18660 [Aeribacillus pallidus]|nr:hypothetical protein APP_18660 [Aeribacillus pallidus]
MLIWSAAIVRKIRLTRKALLQKDHSNIESMSLTSKRWLPEKCARRKKRGVNQVNAILEND